MLHAELPILEWTISVGRTTDWGERMPTSLHTSNCPALNLSCGCEPPSPDLQAYLRANAAGLVDYAQRISTAVAESMVNRVIGWRMAKKQPMRWSRRGAHLLVQIRVAVFGRALASSVSTLVPEIPPAGSPPPPKTTPRFVPLSKGWVAERISCKIAARKGC